MLFNSYHFIFMFLPLCLAGFYLVYSKGNGYWIHWMNLCSMLFYAYWSVFYLCVLSVSVCFNYWIARKIAKGSKALLAFGVGVNLCVLCYFKYFNFFLDTANFALGTHFEWYKIVLPLGISFFTFQKIAFLVDAYQQKVKSVSLPKYLFFVSFFPQLIAGPIVHHSEIFEQFVKPRDHVRNLAVGFSIFCVGLFKKVMIADSVSGISTAVFSFVQDGGQPALYEAWVGALAYTLQIYFDFSAYSDMAVGLAVLFGFSMPQNFASPYKSSSIVEFWRRWHITLSRFLRDYLYIPLGGNRKGEGRQSLNLMITMLLGGFWHGASFNFLIWGGLHGLYLLINHRFQKLCEKGFLPRLNSGIAWLITFVCVVFAWVPFRAVDLESALSVWRGMLLMNGAKLHGHPIAEINSDNLQLVLALIVMCLILPNTSEVFRDTGALLRTKGYPETEKRSASVQWRPAMVWAVACIILFWVAALKLNDPSEFLYFQF